MFVIAGPCVIESENHALECARAIREEIGDFIFKSSFDKANRTSLSSYRGPGINKGLEILGRVKDLGIPVLTDFHEPWQAKPVAEVADILQIPAFLCRQTDMLVAASKTGKQVNIKKGQFMTVDQIICAYEKAVALREPDLTHEPLVTERGTMFGYGDLVVDFRNIVMLRDRGIDVIFDATHSVQTPGGSTTGGKREFIPHLVRAAKAVGINGLFIECHPDPDKALSDAGSQWPIARLKELCSQ